LPSSIDEPNNPGDIKGEPECVEDDDTSKVPLLKELCLHAVRAEDFESDDRWEEFQFYTGFDNYRQFKFFFNLLGQAVYNLHYYSSYSLDSSHVKKRLSPEYQLF